MVDSKETPDTYCRICGSFKYKYHYALESGNQVELYQLVRRDGSLDQLIRPCECRGEFAHAHKICLANWIETTKHEICDICGFKYRIRYIERSIFDYIDETQQVKYLLKVLGAALLIYYISTIGILVCQQKAIKGFLDALVLTSSYVWIVTCTFALTIYIYQSVKKFECWKTNHKRVIVDANPNPQLDSQPKPKDVLKSSGFKPKDKTTSNKFNKLN